MAKPTQIAARAAASEPSFLAHEWTVVEKAHRDPDEDLLRCTRCSALAQRVDAAKLRRCEVQPIVEPAGQPPRASFAAGLGAGRVILSVREAGSSTTEPLLTLALGAEDTLRLLRELSRSLVRAFEGGRRETRHLASPGAYAEPIPAGSPPPGGPI